MTPSPGTAVADVLIHSTRLITAGGDGRPTDVPDAWVHLSDGVVVATGSGPVPAPLTAMPSIDGSKVAGAGAILTSGLIDIHNHGGGGHSFEDGADAMAWAAAAHARCGVTRIVASFVSAPVSVLTAQLHAVAGAAGTNGPLIGVHLEGPCLAHGRRGAHDPEALTPPASVDFAALAASGPLVQVTMAPELAGASGAIAALREAGVRVAVGHTEADQECAAAAFDAGATILTHAFNAMPSLHHRMPGPVGAAMADERVTLEVVADGHHVSPIVVAMLFRAAAGRIALVSDAMAAAAAADGRYRLGGLHVDVEAGRATLAGTDVIAGSTLTLDRAIRNVTAWGVPLTDAIIAATATPALAIGRADLGTLAPGARGDAVLWDRDMSAVAVWRDGEPVER
ncbi:N-acetylglucosamine-6-phosphate deacetylase [Demequina muriae]|uniref:Amidohydrolase family protein n=1 Tax=Demequina muriae TaxID=3051664 RepID=A0ABT8GG45_9MICO|nr:amidohydrolase family protein [Demequina sp. EGI L300058]MDN4480246.1 amidohydrolase family protein [Demequina sp. EGI L300058]